MLKVIVLFLLGISSGLVEGGGLDLPPYISRCSLSDPKLHDCLKVKANQAIPIITKGDVSYSIPPLSPICFAEAPFCATDLKFVLYNTHTSDWNKAVVTKMFVDLKNGNVGFEAVLDKVEFIAKNYTIAQGKMLGIQAFGHGKANITFVNGRVIYSARLRFYKKGDDVYLDYFDSRVDSSCERAYFYFENLHSVEKYDVNAYLCENWKGFFTQMKSAYDDYSKAFVNYVLEPILNQVPFNKMYLL